MHRTSRAGDPDLHTHVAVSNKVQTLDGRWRALDGRVLFKATVAASERYNTRLEAELRQRLGVAFVEVERPGRRPVREIAGVDPRLLAAWSSRRADIDRRRGELTEAFEREHGRTPTPAESIALAQQATLETRERKHDPAAEADQRQQWRHEAEQLLGPDGAQRMVDAALGARCAPAAPTYDGIRAAAGQVIDRIQSDRATWQRWHVLAEAQRVVRTMTLGPEFLDAVVDEIARVALDECSIELAKPGLAVEPDALRRSDGTSVYTVAGSQLYSSRAVLAAEQTILDAATRLDGQRVTAAGVDMALLEATANGLALNEGQVGLVRELAGSGARCQVALAPAGTGKTTALRVLARAWREDGGRVIAAAPSAAAARLLEESTDVPSSTLASLLRRLETEPLGADHLVLVDEAGMARTPDLAQLVDLCVEAGASVRLIGDDRQLAAVGAGGVLRDLAETVGAATLTDGRPVRGRRRGEAAALGVRDGAPEALDFYVDRGRVHVGDDQTAALSAYRGVAGRPRGRPGQPAARRDPQAGAPSSTRAPGPTASPRTAARTVPRSRSADGCAASAGDAIVTRRNDRRLGISATDWVKNGDRWTVDTVHADGSLTATHRDTGRHVVLPCRLRRRARRARLRRDDPRRAGCDRRHLPHRPHRHGGARAALRRDEPRPRGQPRARRAPGRRGRARRDPPRQPRATDGGRPAPADPRPRGRRPLGDDRAAGDRESGDTAARRGRPLPGRADSRTTTCRARSRRRLRRCPGSSRCRPAETRPGSATCRRAPNRSPRWLTRSPQASSAGNHPALSSIAATSRCSRGSCCGARSIPRASRANISPQRERSYAEHLAVRLEQVRSRQPVGRPDTDRWRHLVDAVAPGATGSPHYPELSSELSAAFDARLDVDRLLPTLLHDTDQQSVIAALRGAVERADRDREAARSDTVRTAPATGPRTAAARPELRTTTPLTATTTKGSTDE